MLGNHERLTPLPFNMFLFYYLVGDYTPGWKWYLNTKNISWAKHDFLRSVKCLVFIAAKFKIFLLLNFVKLQMFLLFLLFPLF